MYKCRDCGFEFATPRRYYEYHSEVDTRCYEDYMGCPLCGGVYEEFSHKMCSNCAHFDSLCGICEVYDTVIMDEQELGCARWRWAE